MSKLRIEWRSSSHWIKIKFYHNIIESVNFYFHVNSWNPKSVLREVGIFNFPVFLIGTLEIRQVKSVYCVSSSTRSISGAELRARLTLEIMSLKVAFIPRSRSLVQRSDLGVAGWQDVLPLSWQDFPTSLRRLDLPLCLWCFGVPLSFSNERRRASPMLWGFISQHVSYAI